LHDDIYEKLNSKDGFISDVFAKICKINKLQHALNTNKLDDIEIDGAFFLNGAEYIVEMKMYEHRAGLIKIASKIKEHTHKLCNDVKRIDDNLNPNGVILKPVLLVNIMDNHWLADLQNSIHESSSDDWVKECRVMNVNMLKEMIEKEKK
jgi:hypothetical protein